MKLLLALISVGLAAAGTTPSYSPDCPLGWNITASEETCWKLFDNFTLTAEDAGFYCRSFGAHLLSEHKSVYVDLDHPSYYWIGLMQKPNHNGDDPQADFAWTDKTEVDINRFRKFLFVYFLVCKKSRSTLTTN